MLSLKCDHPFLCKLSILFSTVKLKLRYILSQFIHRFKIWVLKYWFWAVYTSKLFSVHKSGILWFLKPRPQYQIFSISVKCLKIGIFEVPLPSFFCQTVKFGVNEEPIYG